MIRLFHPAVLILIMSHAYLLAQAPQGQPPEIPATAPPRITNTIEERRQAVDRAEKLRAERIPAEDLILEEEEPNEFQRYVHRTTGQLLPLFGRDLFHRVPSTFAPGDRIAVAADYLIGPGDEMIIRAWGAIDVDYAATVDAAGNIYIPRV